MTQATLPPEKQPTASTLQPAENLLGNPVNTDGANSPVQVKVSTEKRPSRERRILASVVIPQPVEDVWKIITDYEHLADFIPSLTSSTLIPNSEGRIRLEQIGTQCFLKVKFCARVVLDMSEHFPHKVGFSMKEGDFRMFEGAWHLSPIEASPTESGQTSPETERSSYQATELSYDLAVKPPLAMPVQLIEHHIRHNLTVNLEAIYHRSLQLTA